MLLETGHARPPARGKRPGTDRTWRPPAQRKLVDEPGRVLTTALVHELRRGRQCRTQWHDGYEATLNVVRRTCHRLAHGAKSARFATTLEQLTVALAKAGVNPKWGEIPPPRTQERRDWIRRRRATVQRYLLDAQLGGLITATGVKDDIGHWWRTEIEVLQAPAVADELLQLVSARIKGFDRREAKRARAHERRCEAQGRVLSRRELALVVQAARALTKAQRAKLGREHGRAIAWSRRFNSETKVLGHPVGALAPNGAQRAFSRTEDNPQHRTMNRRGVRERPRPGSPGWVRPLRGRDRHHETNPCSVQTFQANGDEHEVTERGGGPSGSANGAGLPPEQRSGSDSGRLPGRTGFFDASPIELRRAAQIAETAPSGAQLTPELLEAIVHTFHLRRYGSHAALQTMGTWRPRVAGDKLGRWIAEYERWSTYRPDGWPASGIAALLTFATFEDPATATVQVTASDESTYTWTEQRQLLDRPQVLAGALERLRLLTRLMRAAATIYGKQPRRQRPVDPAAYTDPRTTPASAAPKITFRKPEAAGNLYPESPTVRRERIRDQLQLAGDTPEHYASLETAELALLDHELAGHLSPTIWPSPLAQRATNGHRLPEWALPLDDQQPNARPADDNSTERDPGADARRTLAERYAHDIAQGRWRLSKPAAS